MNFIDNRVIFIGKIVIFIVIVIIVIRLYNMKYNLIENYNNSNHIELNQYIQAKINHRKTIIKDIQSKFESTIIDKTQSQYISDINWINNPNNVLTWENIGETGNKIRITTTTMNKKISLANIQIWGTSIDKNITRNWAISDPTSGPTKLIFSSIESTQDPINIEINEDNPKYISGLDKNQINPHVISCPEGYNITSCNCYSEHGTCNGAQIEGNKCKAISRDKGGKYHANAICLKTVKSDIKYTQQSSQPVNASTSTECADSEQLVSCNCVADSNNSQSCKGTNIEVNDDGKRVCHAYYNKIGNNANKIKAVATCANLPGAELRSTLHKNIKDNKYDNGVSTSSCNTMDDEYLIGCNCYADKITNNEPNTKKNIAPGINSVCIGAKVEDGVCKATSYWKNNIQRNRYPVYADATCIKFNTYGSKCINNNLENNNNCKTQQREKQSEWIDIILPTKVNIKTIQIYNNTYPADNKNTTESLNLYPIKIELYNNNEVKLVALQQSATDNIQLQNKIPPIPDNVLSPDLYNTKDFKIGHSDYYRGWNNIHHNNNLSYCRFRSLDNNETYNNNYLSCYNPSDKKDKSHLIDPGIPSTQYMHDESGTGFDDFCRCVKNNDNSSTLKCLQNNKGYQGDDTEYITEFTPINKNLDHDCQKYSGEELKNINNISKIELYLPPISQYSIDAGFYNESNQKYYIFKNIRFDNTKFVLFCEVDLNHKIMEGYPQFVNATYWGNLESDYMFHIDETIYGGNNTVYFISGKKICKIEYKSNLFTVMNKSDETNFNNFIDISPLESKVNKITCGFYYTNNNNDYHIKLLNNNLMYEFEYDNNNNKYIHRNNNPIADLFKNLNNTGFSFNEINTIINFYNSKQDNILYIYTDTNIYKYNFKTKKFENIGLSALNVKISEFYNNLQWNVHNNKIISNPSPAIS